MKIGHLSMSAIIIALILFCTIKPELHALPLTETMYIVPEYDVELFIKEDLVKGNYMYMLKSVVKSLNFEKCVYWKENALV